MAQVIQGYKPAAMFRFFEEISAIPRGSFHEEGIADYLVAFAEGRELKYRRDAIHNVVIWKPASAGAEGAPAVMLQGHTDMVCEKLPEVAHDFTKDGIRLIVEDGILRADGTTLGADNGVAVMYMLAVLDDKTLVHPPLECVFTVREEAGLIGARELDTSDLTAKTMINLDSGREGFATVGCAGGLCAWLRKEAEREELRSVELLALRVRGLPGGHSGTEIHRNNRNAIKAMARILDAVREVAPFRLAQIDGGAEDNAIPRDCDAVLAFGDAAGCEAARIEAERMAELIAREMAHTDFRLLLERSVGSVKAFDREESGNIIDLLLLAPNGPFVRSEEAGGFVVSSSNLGVITTGEHGVEVTFAPRSSVASLQEQSKAWLRLLGRRFGFALRMENEYPGWSYAEVSPVRDAFLGQHQALFGKQMQPLAIHAGLECGLFIDRMPGLDAIAVGPRVTGCHTPEERLELASCGRVYRLLTAVLGELAGK